MKQFWIFLMMLTVWSVRAELIAVKDCTVEKQGESYRVSITGNNPRLCEYDLEMQPADYQALRLVYSATNLPKTFPANFFYLPKGTRNFTGECRLPLYNLISDGKTHEAEVKLPEKWYQSNVVTALRFDPVNNNPQGEFVIHKLLWIRKPKAGEYCWDKENDFDKWGNPMRGTIAKANGTLLFTIQGKNSRLYNESVKIETQNVSALEIRYRANGLPAGASGNFFFRHAGEKQYNDSMRAGVRGIVADGKWHTLKITLPASWKAAAPVVALRLDPADQAESGTIEIESIRFVGGPEKAETLNTVPAWQVVQSVLPASGSKTLPPVYWKAKMVFSPEDKGEEPRPFAVRRTFSVSGNLAYALLQITADDCFAVWINGKLVLDRLSEHLWSEPVAKDVTKFLQPGKENLICIKYVNYSGPGGVLFQIGLMNQDGKLTEICSDEKAVAAKCPAGNDWLSPDFPVADWSQVSVGGTPPEPPWRKELPFRDVSRTIFPELLAFDAPQTAVAGKPCRVSIRLKTDRPIPPQRFSVKLFTLPNQIALPEKFVDLPAYQAGENTIAFDLPLPRYFSDCKMRYVITSNCLSFPADLCGEIAYRGTPMPGKAIPFEVKKTELGARLFADGKAIHMLCGNAHVTDSRYPSKLEQVPVNFRTCHVKMNAPHKIWIRSLNGDYDFSVIDRCAETRLEIDPDVYLIFSIEVGLPHKFADAFKDDVARREDGSTFPASVLSVQPGSALNKKVVQDALTALVQYCEKAPYASRVAGFLVADGETMEWQYFGSSRAFLSNSLVDYSVGAKAHYQKVTGEEMPTTAERLNAKAGLFYDVTTQQPLIRCNGYFSEIMAQNVIDYCRTLKQAMTVPKLCGVYYGYHFEYGDCNWRRQIAGHNRLREVLDSGVVDFLTSPPSYPARNLGNSGADMKPFASISQAGVLPIIDDDTRTHLIAYNGYYQTLTQEQTTSIVRRNLGQYLCRQECVWMLPLIEGREFDDPQTLRDLAAFKKAAAWQIANNVRRNCEIAVVVDERTYDYLAPDSQRDCHESIQFYEADGKVTQTLRRTDRLFGELVANQRERLAKLGAPVDYLLASDVAKNLDKYKLWIFLDTFQYDKTFLNAVRQLQAKPVTIVWCYAPGYIHGQSMNTENMERLTGVKFTQLPTAGSLEMEMQRKDAPPLLMGYPETVEPRFAVVDKDASVRGKYHDADAVAIAQKHVGQSDTWFFGGNFISSAVWRNLAQQAGIHVYSGSDDTLFANDAFVAIHAERPGKKTIRLPHKVPAVWDLFNHTKIADDTQEFSFDAKLHESRVFYLGELASDI